MSANRESRRASRAYAAGGVRPKGGGQVAKRALIAAERAALAHRTLAVRLGGVLRDLQARGLVPQDKAAATETLLRRVDALEA